MVTYLRKDLSQRVFRSHNLYHLVEVELKCGGLCEHRASYVRPESFFGDRVDADP